MLKTAYKRTLDLLRHHKMEDAENIARLLCAEISGVPPLAVPIEEQVVLNEAQTLLLEHRARCVIEGEPLAYVLGSQAFLDMALFVGEGVLIPRPETEELCRLVMEKTDKHRQIRLLDMCTGSGAIAIALARALPKAQVDAVDLSAEALYYARQNAKDYKVTDRVFFYQGDLWDAVPEKALYDVIVSNPPYIETEAWQTLDERVRKHEPRMALDAGEDGLAFYRRIAEKLPDYLTLGGMFFCEVGYNQARAVAALLENVFKQVWIYKDMQGVPRMVQAMGRKAYDFG